MVFGTTRPPGREHTLGLPRAFIAVRIIQLVLAVLVMGLDAYGLYVIPFSGAALNMFTAIATIIACVYMIVAEFGPAAFYNYWAILALDIFLSVFWLISFALMAAQVAPLFASYSYYDYSDYSYYYGSYYSSYSYYSIAFLACMAAVAGIGGLLFSLFCVTVILTGIGIHRHRAAGGHCTPGAAHTAAAVSTAPGGEKAGFGAVAAPLPVYAGAPAAYGQQPQTQPMYGAPPAGYAPPQQYGQPPQQPYGQPQQQQFAPVHPGQTMSPPPQHMYGTPPPQSQSPPLAQPQPMYGAPPQGSPSPITSQPTGGSFVQPPPPGHSELPPHRMPDPPQQLSGTPVQQQLPYNPPQQ